jgi:hypothetical protein
VKYVKYQVFKICENIVREDPARVCPVTKVSRVTMVLELLTSVSHFAGKVEYCYFI